MDRKSGYFIVLGLVIGAVLGMLWGSLDHNVVLGLGLGALGGVFIGWFAVAAEYRNRSEKKEEK